MQIRGGIRITTKAHTCCQWSSRRDRRFTRLTVPDTPPLQVRALRFSKPFIPERQVILNPVVPSRSGEALLPYTGPDRITVGGELEKLASNISLGRNFAGMHWRSDHTVSLRLGEKVAISCLYDQAKLFNETYSFKCNRFSGTTITISRSSTFQDLRGWLDSY
jgi:hypothetical protein